MSVTVSYQRISPEKFTHLQNNPELAEDFFHPDFQMTMDIMNKMSQARLENDGELIQQLSKQALEVLHRDKASVYEGYQDTTKTRLSLEKEWQAIHYLLTGEVEFDNSQAETILKNVVMGGIQTEFEGTCYLSPEEVKELAQILQEVPEQDLRLRFDERGDREIYSQEDEWDEEIWELLSGAIDAINYFFKTAAINNEAILILHSY
jgi:hypothetical protein